METILLIESEPADLVVQALILRSFGYNVLETANASEAMHACDGYPGPIHLVFARDGPGEEVAAQLTRRFPQICLLLMSEARREKLGGEHSHQCGCAFLVKPFRVQALAGAISEMLGRQRLTTAA